MHIPTSRTDEIQVLSFSEALEGSAGSAGAYNREKWIYVPDYYSEYRYILGTRGVKPLICIGINPSTAEPENLDPTLKSAQRISLANGYDSFIMFNVYAQRATRPDDMEKSVNPFLHSENMKAFRYIMSLSACSRPAIWAAWGAIIEKRDYLPRCVRDMIAVGDDYGAEWFSAGKISKKGHPHHPLYLKSNTPLDKFDVKAYLAKLSPESETYAY